VAAALQRLWVRAENTAERVPVPVPFP
jgi:hypothetical protein